METPEIEGCFSKEQGIIFDHMESDNNNNYKSKGKYLGTVQSRFSDIKFSDNLWFGDYFAKTIFQFTT